MIGIGWGKMVDGARDDSIGRRGEGHRWCGWSGQGGDGDLFVCFKFGMRGKMVREGGYGWGKGGGLRDV